MGLIAIFIENNLHICIKSKWPPFAFPKALNPFSIDVHDFFTASSFKMYDDIIKAYLTSDPRVRDTWNTTLKNGTYRKVHRITVRIWWRKNWFVKIHVMFSCTSSTPNWSCVLQFCEDIMTLIMWLATRETPLSPTFAGKFYFLSLLQWTPRAVLDYQ